VNEGHSTSHDPNFNHDDDTPVLPARPGEVLKTGDCIPVEKQAEAIYIQFPFPLPYTSSASTQ
jgi:hypothetical protein